MQRASFLGGWVAMVVGAALVIGGMIPGEARAGDLATAPLPRPEVLDQALAAYYRVEQAGLRRTTILSVIDYSLPSSERRLWVFDLAQPLRLLFHEYVAHGRGSTTDDEPDRAIRFGNEEASLRSSLGTFLTGATYQGQHGRSLELYGLESRPSIDIAASVEEVHGAFQLIAGELGRRWREGPHRAREQAVHLLPPLGVQSPRTYDVLSGLL